MCSDNNNDYRQCMDKAGVHCTLLLVKQEGGHVFLQSLFLRAVLEERWCPLQL